MDAVKLIVEHAGIGGKRHVGAAGLDQMDVAAEAAVPAAIDADLKLSKGR
jgi:hypothetical protein